MLTFKKFASLYTKILKEGNAQNYFIAFNWKKHYYIPYTS